VTAPKQNNIIISCLNLGFGTVINKDKIVAFGTEDEDCITTLMTP
jgi:hypothetical protein